MIVKDFSNWDRWFKTFSNVLLILAACQSGVKPVMYKNNDYTSMVWDQVAYV